MLLPKGFKPVTRESSELDLSKRSVVTVVNWSVTRDVSLYRIRAEQTVTNQSLRNSKGLLRSSGWEKRKRLEKSQAGRLCSPIDNLVLMERRSTCWPDRSWIRSVVCSLWHLSSHVSWSSFQVASAPTSPKLWRKQRKDILKS